MTKRRVLKALGLGLVCMIVGCAENKLTRHNYEMIREGASTREEVKLTLGDNYTATASNRWEYEDEDNHRSIVIRFDESGKVNGKEWRDAATGEWEGQAPGIDPNPEGRTISESSGTQTIKK